MLECLMLEDRLELIAKKRQLWSSLGYGSRLAFNSWAENLKRVRNVLAHGGGLLDAERDPSQAVALFNNVRVFSENVWNRESEPNPSR